MDLRTYNLISVFKSIDTVITMFYAIEIETVELIIMKCFEK